MGDLAETDARLARLTRRAERERAARQEAERLLEDQSRALQAANRKLAELAATLEARVAERTRELSEARESALALAERDQLTGLANRACFARRLDGAIVRARAEGRVFALLLLDLDRFKEINDSLGHEAGDAVLRHVAACLAAVPGAACAARLGGDEFALILDADGTDAETAAGALIAELRRPVPYRGQPVETGASIGVSLYPEDAEGAADLLRCADIALYRAKLGRGTQARYEAAMGRAVEARRRLGADLARALRAGEIVAWFQPVVEAASCATVGVEALARWIHPVRGLIPPAEFLPLAEERGLMPELFARMLRAACPPARAWLEAGAIRQLSVNVSPSQFRSGTLAQETAALLAELGFPPAALTLEITEEVLMSDLDRARTQIQQLAALGIGIALDDFGIGYSNIGYLRQLPFRTLKLDRSLTVGLTEESKVRRVLGAIVDLARALDLEIVAEGVEDSQQALWLTHLGCRRLQGYLFGRPLPAEAYPWSGAGAALARVG